MDLYSIYEETQKKNPGVQCITNIVTVNDCANILLAAGASPAMTMDIREAAEAVRRMQALVCNMGAIEYSDSMISAGQEANRCGIPVVLDPVAAGGTRLRRDVAAQLLKDVHFAAIRGNATEIRALAGKAVSGRGVDVALSDEVTEENISETAEMVRALSAKLGSVVALSGVIDVVSDGRRTAFVRNGCATMARITGSGCMLTSLMGGFIGAAPDRPFEAALASVAVMGVAGELAEEKRIARGSGNASFRTDLIDSVFTLSREQFEAKQRFEVKA
ncbi:MAG: hydroxyethylthiazole kinase [Lachnospiraceae bacterium]|jgi:hydroxyethylthiazole kinase